jgi:purine-nucleoside phosphorylase
LLHFATTHNRGNTVSTPTLFEAFGITSPSSKTLGIILGSGWGEWADQLPNVRKVPFVDLGLPTSSVAGHSGNFCVAEVGGLRIFVMQGRVHYYEGHPMSSVTRGVRLMAEVGATHLVLTNAAGGIEPNYKVGDLVLIQDHINQLPSPLTGPNNDKLGQRFPHMNDLYTRAWRERVYQLSQTAGLDNHVRSSGVYLATSGPQYETPAEIRAFHNLGAHLVGMSTTPEAIVARHARIPNILGISCVTNKAAGLSEIAPSHEEVVETLREAMGRATTLLNAIVSDVASQT